MGNFDRNATPKKNGQTKQVVLAGTLGAVLLGVVGYHFMKKGPQSAIASEGEVTPMVELAPDDTAESATRALREDLYQKLLQARPQANIEIEKLPRNPFLMSDSWRGVLVKAVEPVAPSRVEIRTPQIGPAPRIVPQAANLEKFKLASIFRHGDKYSAILNGKIVSPGMIIDGAKVVDIQDDRVLLQNAQFTDGPISEVVLDSKLQ